jgi:hypothetical protein
VLCLPLQQILRANNVMYRRDDPDHFVKHLQNVTLTDADVRRIAGWAHDGVQARH